MIEGHGLVIAGFPVLRLRTKPGCLILGVVQLGETICDLATGNEQLETVDDERVVIVFTR